MAGALAQLLQRSGRWFGGAGGAVLPQSCYACSMWTHPGDGPLCARCAAAFRSLQSTPYCPHCGRTVSPLTIDERGCGVCRREQHWRVHRLVRVAPYEPPVDVVVKGLKYRGMERHGELLAGWLAEAIERASWRGEIQALVPVPMHWIRWWNRPCPHALVLARLVAARLRLPVRKAVARKRHTQSQLRVPTHAARLENVKGCFEPARGARVSGRTVCIIDNVMVSGATVCEVAKALRAAGAKRVYAAIVARSTMAGEENLRVAPIKSSDAETGAIPIAGENRRSTSDSPQPAAP